jgi:hypothetical protein
MIRIICFAKVQMPREPQYRPCVGRSSDFSPIAFGAFPVMMQRDVATSGMHAERCLVEGVTAAGTVQESHLVPF